VNAVNTGRYIGFYFFDLRAYLGVIIVNNLTLVCLSVMSLQIAFPFSFLDGIEPFFVHQFSMWHSTKRFS